MTPSHDPFATQFAHTVFKGKYPFTPDEEWNGCSERVVAHVLTGLHEAPAGHRVLRSTDAHARLYRLMAHRMFIPGGRYLYGAGRPFHQVNNCLLLRAEDTREGWGRLKQQAMLALMTGAGIGVYYGDLREKLAPVVRTGGVSSGPVPLMVSVDADGRASVQGGDRRCAIWAGLPWWHADIDEFLRVKDWPVWMREAIAKRNAGDRDYKDFYAPMESTNISVCLDDEFFAAYDDEAHPRHDLAHRVYWKTVEKMTCHGEPGFSVDLGDKHNEVLRNAPVAGSTRVLTSLGYRAVDEILDTPVKVWTGKQWAPNVVFRRTKFGAKCIAVQLTGGREIQCDPEHPFILENGERIAARNLVPGVALRVSMPRIKTTCFDSGAYTLGWLYGDGSFTPGGGADLSLCSNESKACLPYLSLYNSVNMEDSRGFMRLYFSRGLFSGRSKKGFPLDVFSLSDDACASFLAGLFDSDGNYEPVQQRIRLANKHFAFLRGCARLLEQLGIMAHVSKAGMSTYGQSQGWQLVVASGSVQAFAHLIPTKRLRPVVEDYKPYRQSKIKVISVTELVERQDVFCANVGVPEHSFMAEGVIVSNCTEITSEDDSDVCNLGSLVLPRYPSPEQFGEAVRDAVLFLTAGSLYSDVSYSKVLDVREKNRRLGLGLIGVHEFCMQHGVRYGTDAAFEVLEPYMEQYARALEYANDWQDKLRISRSVGATAIAPNGTIGILAESSPSGDPIPVAAKKRIVITASPDGDTRTVHIVIDPVAQRLLDKGVESSMIEDVYSIDYERRIAQQAFLQRFTDHAVSSTINLPHQLFDPQDRRDFGDTLMRYLPDLRGITAYPDGARPGQPIQPVPLEYALEHEGESWVEGTEAECASGACGV